MIYKNMIDSKSHSKMMDIVHEIENNGYFIGEWNYEWNTLFPMPVIHIVKVGRLLINDVEIDIHFVSKFDADIMIDVSINQYSSKQFNLQKLEKMNNESIKT